MYIGHLLDIIKLNFAVLLKTIFLINISNLFPLKKDELLPALSKLERGGDRQLDTVVVQEYN